MYVCMCVFPECPNKRSFRGPGGQVKGLNLRRRAKNLCAETGRAVPLAPLPAPHHARVRAITDGARPSPSPVLFFDSLVGVTRRHHLYMYIFIYTYTYIYIYI